MENRINKGVCVKCRMSNSDKRVQWGDLDDRLWNEAGHVKCYGCSLDAVYYPIEKGVPENCVMKLEQIIMKQGGDE